MVNKGAAFGRRVEERLAEWNGRYAERGVECASPLMDRIMAEEQVANEMESEADEETSAVTEAMWPLQAEALGHDDEGQE